MSWRSYRASIRRAGDRLLSNGARADRYGKTVGPYKPKYGPKKKGNRVKFEFGEKVTVGGCEGTIVDHYEYDRVFFYRIKWNEPQLTWYDKHVGQPASHYGWEQSRFIRRKDVNN